MPLALSLQGCGSPMRVIGKLAMFYSISYATAIREAAIPEDQVL